MSNPGKGMRGMAKESKLRICFVSRKSRIIQLIQTLPNIMSFLNIWRGLGKTNICGHTLLVIMKKSEKFSRCLLSVPAGTFARPPPRQEASGPWHADVLTEGSWEQNSFSKNSSHNFLRQEASALERPFNHIYFFMYCYHCSLNFIRCTVHIFFIISKAG